MVGETRRATIQEASRILGVSEGAVRKRVKRGTLPHYKEQPSGRVYVHLEGGSRGVDQGVDNGVSHDSEALISEMRGRIADLRDQLASERQAHAEARRLLAAALERIPPQIEAPPEQPSPAQASEEAAEQPAQGAVRVGGYPPGGGEPQSPAEPLPWWRRMFGG
jgi:hypothetical protein